MFKLLRFFSLTSFVSIVVAAVLLGLFYRYHALQTITEHGNRENVSTAMMISNTLWDDVQRLFKQTRTSDPILDKNHPLIQQLRNKISSMARGLDVAKIKIYRPDGTTVFSTDLSQVGEQQNSNPGILNAMLGSTTSDFVHKDSINALDQVIENRDLLQTYMPLYDREGQHIIGVVEVYSDHTDILAQVRETQWTMMFGTSVVLLLLYSVLYLIVRHANKILIQQDGQLRESLEELNKARETLETRVSERTRTLTISNQLLEKEIRERGRVEQTVRERERRIRAIMDNIFNAIVTIDDEGLLQSFNPTAERIFAYSADQVIGKPFAMLMPAGQDFTPQQLIQEQSENKECTPAACMVEIMACRKGGVPFPIEIAITRIEDSQNACFIGTIRDISERKRAEAELQETREKYFHQEKMAAIGTLSAGIVHEIGNPIAAISGLIQEIVLEDDEDKTLKPFIRSNMNLIQDHVSRLVNITRDVSEFSTPHTGEIQLLDLNNLIEKTCRLMNYDKRFKGIVIELDLEPMLPAVSAVSDQIVQVLMNLLINSIDAVNEVEDRQPVIVVKTEMIDDMVQFTVSDNGIGMTHDNMEHATEAFYTTKLTGHGSGLGLSLCHSIVSAHRGNLIIDSTPGEGTRVSVLLNQDLEQLQQAEAS